MACSIRRRAGSIHRGRRSRRSIVTDFLIAGAGFRNALADRAELSQIAPHVLSWADRPDFPEEIAPDGPLGTAPYLAPDFTFVEKTPGACPALARIHCFNDAAMLSHGKVSGDIPAVSVGAKRLGRAIAAAFFAEDVTRQFERLQAYDTAELVGDEYTPSPALPGVAAQERSVPFCPGRTLLLRARSRARAGVPCIVQWRIRRFKGTFTGAVRLVNEARQRIPTWP